MLPICAEHDVYFLSYKNLNIFVCTCSRIDDTYVDIPSGNELIAGRRRPLSVGIVDTRLAFLEKNESEYNSAARTLLSYVESLLRREHVVFPLQTPRLEIIVF